MLKQNLLKTKPKVNVASKFVGVTKTDNQGRPSNLVVPGSQGKRYDVIIRRFPKTKTISCECHLDIAFGHLDCPGNSNHKNKTLCYHSRSATMYALEQQGLDGAWCSTYQDALTLNQLKKGDIYTVVSHQSGGKVYLVVSKKVQMKLC